jgi:hypothetical protein
MKKKYENVDVATLVTNHPFLELFAIKPNAQLLATVKRRGGLYAAPLVVKFERQLIVVYNVEQVLAAIENGVAFIDVILIERSTEAEIMAFVAEGISYGRTEKYVQRYRIIDYLRRYFLSKTEDSKMFYEWCVGGDMDDKISSVLGRSKTWVYEIRTVGDWDVNYLRHIDNKTDPTIYTIKNGVKGAQEMQHVLDDYPLQPDALTSLENTVADLISQFRSGIKPDVQVVHKDATSVTFSIEREPFVITLKMDWIAGGHWGEAGFESSQVNKDSADNEGINP